MIVIDSKVALATTICLSSLSVSTSVSVSLSLTLSLKNERNGILLGRQRQRSIALEGMKKKQDYQ